MITRTISYDRAGIGKSELLDSARTLERIVFELKEILEKENFNAPYILVGHSSGGHIVRYFMHIHPMEVAGLILIDPSVEYLSDEFRRLKTEAEIKSYDSLYEYGRDPTWPEGLKREADYFRKNELTIKKTKFPDNIPITVLTAMWRNESSLTFLRGVNQIKLDLHKRWLTEAPQIKHIITDSGHHIQLEEPLRVINEIKAMIEVVRSNQFTKNSSKQIP